MSKESKCQHGVRKYYCVECKGTGICSHGKRKSQCKECHGGSICVHKNYKYSCLLCDGTGICSHGKRIQRCKECNGSSYCEHEKRKDHCILCSSSAFCIHKKRKNRCVKCGGISICIHNKEKQKCVDCNGSGICIHKKRKSRCKICDGKELCKTHLCEVIGQKKYDGYCVRCFLYQFPDKPIARNYRTKEFSVAEFVKNIFPNFSWRENKALEDACSKKRPDLSLDMGSHLIIIEIDEFKHQNQNYSCENKRIMQLSQDVAHRPIVFIRFNPDAYLNEVGEKVKSCWGITPTTGMCKIVHKEMWENRLAKLKERIEYWIVKNPEKIIELDYLYYDANESNEDDSMNM